MVMLLNSWLASLIAHALLHPSVSECDCRCVGHAAVIAGATDPGQSGSSNAGFYSKEPDTAATHFAGMI